MRTRAIHVTTNGSLVHHVPSNNRLSHLTIIIVEDHDDSRTALGLFLNQTGANVVLTSSVPEAMEAIKMKHVALVLSDIQMPDFDGFDLLREIRALGPNAGGDVPVIAMSGFALPEDRKRVLDAGFKEFLPKPVKPERLLQAISKALAD